MERTTDLTYQDLLELFPEEDRIRRELIGGELFVTAAPTLRHQRIVTWLTLALSRYTEGHGGEVFGVEVDTFISPSDVVQPDLILFSEEASRRLSEQPVTVIPELVVEVSSPSTRKRDRTVKRDLYARHGVPEYWFVDLDADRIEVDRLEEGHYGESRVLGRGELLESGALPGLALSVDDVLGPVET